MLWLVVGSLYCRWVLTLVVGCCLGVRACVVVGREGRAPFHLQQIVRCMSYCCCGLSSRWALVLWSCVDANV